MLAKMELIALDGSGVVHKAFNMNAVLHAPTKDEPEREVEVSKMTLNDVPVLDGTGYHIACMYTV
jgi:hypothetical protein